MNHSEHNSVVIEQFTRQAAPFAKMHTAERSIDLLKHVADVSADDVVLDVACGPGLVACAFAAVAKRVTGVDITPAMLDQAKDLQQREKLTNVGWKLAEGAQLPFDDGSFSLVLSRYAFHHLENPKAVLAEMARVCQPGGRVCVADVYVTNDAQEQLYNRIEIWRDPSHVRALRLDAFRTIFTEVGLSIRQQAFYRFDVAVDRLLESTRTPEPEATQFREAVAQDVGHNLIGANARYDEAGVLQFSFPIVVTCGVRG